MREVHIKNGLKQRLPEILGTDYGLDNDGVSDITPWSIQAAMLSNVKRVSSAIVGDFTDGRPMKGLILSKVNSTQFSISAGIGFASNGNVVTLGSSVQVSVTGYTGDIFIYLRHYMAVAEEATHNYGKNTSFIADSGKKEIVLDDAGEINSSDPSVIIDNLVYISTVRIMESDDKVYLGQITLTGGSIANSSDVVNNSNRGFVTSNVVVSGVFAPSVTNSAIVPLPSDFTYDNCFITSAQITLPSGYSGYTYMLPLLVVSDAGISSMRVSIKNDNTFDFWSSKHGTADVIPFGDGAYKILLQKIS